MSCRIRPSIPISCFVETMDIMRQLSPNVNCNVYETDLTFGKIAPRGQAHVRLNRRRGEGGGHAASPTSMPLAAQKLSTTSWVTCVQPQFASSVRAEPSAASDGNASRKQRVGEVR